MFGRRALSEAGLMAWNLLPDTEYDPTRSFDSFRRDFKNTFLSLRTQSIKGLAIMRYKLTLILT